MRRLRDADLREANLTSTDLGGADLTSQIAKALLSDSDFSGGCLMPISAAWFPAASTLGLPFSKVSHETHQIDPEPDLLWLTSVKPPFFMPGRTRLTCLVGLP